MTRFVAFLSFKGGESFKSSLKLLKKMKKGNLKKNLILILDFHIECPFSSLFYGRQHEMFLNFVSFKMKSYIKEDRRENISFSFGNNKKPLTQQFTLENISMMLKK